MKIAFFGLEKDAQGMFTEELKEAELVFIEGKLDESTASLAGNPEALCVFVGGEVNRKVIDAMPNLKYIATRSTGYDHIDCEYAKGKGIAISNVPGYGSYTVAEFTFGLILNLSRNIIRANNYIKESLNFTYSPVMQGFDLAGKTLGVIGTGKIGKNVIKIAKGFSMNVVAYDLHPDEKFAQENNFAYKSLDEVIRESDIITLHAPSTKENHHLVNKEFISKMKPGAWIVNTARGDLIDTDALVWGLKEGIVSGAGLDVLEGERELKEEIEILARGGEVNYKTLLEDRALMEMPNVIVTPHIAFYTREAVNEILKITALNLKGFISGSLINVV